MHLRDTIPIVFNGGSYGTYLEWVLHTLTNANQIELPFTESGSSHQYIGRHVDDMQGWRNYAKGDIFYPFVRLHPKTHEQESLSQNLNEIANCVNHMIYLYPDPDSVLLVINNWASKIQSDWWITEVNKTVGLEQIYKNWPDCTGLSADQIPVWVQREFLSYYLMPAWYAQVEWYHPDHWSHPNCHVVSIRNLMNNFEQVVESIGNLCNLSFCRSIVEIAQYHQKMLQLQKYQTQDQLCKQIVANCINGVDMDWSNEEMPLVSQSWIQWQLRNLGWELRCNGLDTWPTNSVHLKNLLFQINQ